MHKRIKLLIEKLKLNQTGFAERLGFNRSYVSRIVNSEQVINEKFIRAVCKEFNVSEEWIRTGKGEIFLPARSNDEFVTEKSLDDFVAATMQLPQEFQDFIIQVGLTLCDKRGVSPLNERDNRRTDEGDSTPNLE